MRMRAGIWDERSIWTCMKAMRRGGCRRGMESGAIIIGEAGQRVQGEGLHAGTEAGQRGRSRFVTTEEEVAHRAAGRRMNMGAKTG